MYLVRQDKVQNFFIKFIFGRKAKVLTNLKGINAPTLTESASFISDANTGKIKYFIRKHVFIFHEKRFDPIRLFDLT